MREPLEQGSSQAQISLASRRLLEFALSGPSHETVVERALSVVSEALCEPWTFEEEPELRGGVRGIPVRALGAHLGYLIPAQQRSSVLLEGDSAEMGLAFGACLLIADQGRAISEMESASADFLKFAPDALFVLDAAQVVTMTNRKALELLERGEHEVLGRPLRMLFSFGIDAGPKSERIEVELATSGGLRLVSLGFSEIADGNVLCLARDITKERLAHLAVRRAERAVMLGQAVEYLVHEVNNPLAALLSSTNIERRKIRELVTKLEASLKSDSGGAQSRQELLDIASRLRVAAESAHASAERIRVTMATLRHAHRQLGEIESERIDLGYELGLAIGIIEQEMNSAALPRVDILREIGPLSRVWAPPLVLAETVAAILRNAVHFAAVGRGAQGRVWIRAGLRDGTPVVEIEDNGPGIAAAHSERVFMPFFTTRADEGALGLGLAQARDAISRLGGDVSVVASDAGGACLRLVLPQETSAECIGTRVRTE